MKHSAQDEKRNWIAEMLLEKRDNTTVRHSRSFASLSEVAHIQYFNADRARTADAARLRASRSASRRALYLV